jgi:peptidoglycan/LPS O-acetylase OafA/YrhL
MNNTLSFRFANLDGLRFIAAMLVVVNHTEQISGILGLTSFYSIPGVEQAGKFGVKLFFALSGFLITYLLIKEKDTTGDINIKAFYIRRILRIWPLYLLIVILAIFVFHYIPILDLNAGNKSTFYDNLVLKLLFFLFMLPNLVLLVFGPIAFASQTWSIGSEEQFYVIWPLILKRIKISVISLFAIIVSYHLFVYLFQNYVRSNIYREYCVALMQTVPIDLMAIGGIVAVVINVKSETYVFLNKIFSKNFTKIFLVLILLTLLFTGYRFDYFNNLLYGIFISALIFILTREYKNTILESGFFRLGGKISYGIYMWHAPIITFVLKSLVFFNINSKLLAYPLILLFTMIVSWISYHYFELPFLNLKKKFTVVSQG